MALENDKVDRLDTVPQAFIAQIQRLLPELYAALLQRVDLDIVDGKIATTEANINKVFAIIDEYADYILNPANSPYIREVKGFMGQFDIQKQINDQILKEFGNTPTTSQVVYTAARRQTAELLVGDGFRTNFIDVVRQTMIDSVSSNRSYVDMVKALQTQIEGVLVTTKEGTIISQSQLLNWNKQVAHDRFAITDRAYTMAAAEEFNVKWFKYVGGLIEDSRKFCVERNGNYYHKSQIADWPVDAGKWDGRMKGTDAQTIFIYCGGYRCNHSLIPYPASRVPKELRDFFKDK